MFKRSIIKSLKGSNEFAKISYGDDKKRNTHVHFIVAHNVYNGPLPN